MADAVDLLADDGTGIINIVGDFGDTESDETMTIEKPMTIVVDVSGSHKIGVLTIEP